jgi:hypothetical protein
MNRWLFGIILSFFCCELPAQARPLTEADKNWLDSMFIVLGKPSSLAVYFDKKMKEEGTVSYAVVRDRYSPFKINDSIISFYRNLYPDGNIPADGHSHLAFCYNVTGTWFSFGYWKVYLNRGQQPIFYSKNAGGWRGAGFYSVSIHSGRDTVYQSLPGQGDTTIEAPWNKGKYLLICPNGYYNSKEILQVIIGKKTKRFGKETLVECALDSFVAGMRYVNPKFQRGSIIRLLFEKDAREKCNQGDTILLTGMHFFDGDSLRIYDYAKVLRVHHYKLQDIEDIVFLKTGEIHALRFSFFERWRKILFYQDKNVASENKVFRYLRRKKYGWTIQY